MYYTQEQIDRANQADLVSFLQSQGEQLTRAGNEYRWKTNMFHQLACWNIANILASINDVTASYIPKARHQFCYG